MSKYLFIVFFQFFSSLLFALEADSASLGKKLYETQCILCHGSKGFDLSAPIIAGMEESYLKAQLNAFMPEGTRTDELMFVMNDWVERLNQTEINSLVTYVHSLSPCSVVKPQGQIVGDKANGQRLSQERSCLECHLNKTGASTDIRRQKGSYIAYALNSFQKGIRKNTSMEKVVKGLTQSDILDLASYFSSIDFCK